MDRRVMTVLLVDDEPLVRSNLRYALRRAAVATRIVGEADNGEDALALYLATLPDVVVTDIRMPQMDGLALIERIRRTDRMTRIIIVSGYADFEYARRAMSRDVTHYLLKPVKVSELEAALEECASGLQPRYGEEVLSESDRVVAYLEAHFAEPLTLERLSAKFSFNPKYLSSLVKNKVGIGFTDYLLRLRVRQAAELLACTGLEIKTVAARVGYEDPQYFHRVFKKSTGRTPAEYRRDARSRHAAPDCPETPPNP